MKTDKLFYEYFQLAPHAIFELLQMTPLCAYRFESPVVKASERRLDGLLEPVDPACPHYFIELQGYDDASIYWRVVHQVGVYHAQRAHLNSRPWQAFVLFLDQAYDPGIETLGTLYHGEMPWLVRAVLPALLTQVTNPSPVLHVLWPLAIRDEAIIRQQGAGWTAAIRQASEFDVSTQTRLLTLLVQFVGQRFVHLSRKEIESMLKLTPFEETVAGQEYIAEGIQKGIEQGIEQAIFAVLTVRFNEVPEALLNRIDQVGDQEILKTLLKRAVTVESLANFEKFVDENIHLQ